MTDLLSDNLPSFFHCHLLSVRPVLQLCASLQGGKKIVEGCSESPALERRVSADPDLLEE